MSHTNNAPGDDPTPPDPFVVSVTTSPYNALLKETYLGVNVAGASLINLPTAVGNDGKRFVIKDESGAAMTNPITVDPFGLETIDGGATAVIALNNNSMTIIARGGNWYVI